MSSRGAKGGLTAGSSGGSSAAWASASSAASCASASRNQRQSRSSTKPYCSRTGRSGAGALSEIRGLRRGSPVGRARSSSLGVSADRSGVTVTASLRGRRFARALSARGEGDGPPLGADAVRAVSARVRGRLRDDACPVETGTALGRGAGAESLRGGETVRRRRGGTKVYAASSGAASIGDSASSRYLPGLGTGWEAARGSRPQNCQPLTDGTSRREPP